MYAHHDLPFLLPQINQNMKNLLFISILMLTSIVFSSFSTSPSMIALTPFPTMDLSGDWKLEIDTSLDGTPKGNLGCNGIYFYPMESRDASGRATYIRPCPNKVTNRKTEGSFFTYQTYESKRGSILSMVLHAESTQYFATFSGQIRYQREGASIIEGVWTDVEGNKGDFRLTEAQ